ncbi:MAG: DUF4390 domain-containing protein [candidate division NC10 bacterium]|nr:DUF4390 domain-containing protein [candidate division NC10 bacterium]
MKLRPIMLLLAVSLGTAALFAAQDPAEAKEARITDIIVTHNSGNLLVYATLVGAFTKEVEESMVSGTPTTFTYHLRLMKSGSFWRDQEVTSLTVRQTVTYELLQDEFRFERGGGADRLSRSTKSFQEVKKWMGGLEGIKVVPYQALGKEELYYIQIRAEIRSIELAFPLNYLLFFVSFFNFDTPWADSPYFRVGR